MLRWSFDLRLRSASRLRRLESMRKNLRESVLSWLMLCWGNLVMSTATWLNLDLSQSFPASPSQAWCQLGWARPIIDLLLHKLVLPIEGPLSLRCVLSFFGEPSPVICASSAVGKPILHLTTGCHCEIASYVAKSCCRKSCELL